MRAFSEGRYDKSVVSCYHAVLLLRHHVPPYTLKKRKSASLSNPVISGSWLCTAEI